MIYPIVKQFPGLDSSPQAPRWFFRRRPVAGLEYLYYDWI